MGPAARIIGRAVATAATAALFLLVAAAPALAHNSLTGSNPADGATLARAPASVRLTFLATLDPGRTKVTITGPDGAAAGGAAVFARNRVTVPLRAGPAGRYTVAYELPSADGHPIKGEVRFTLRTGVAPAATPTSGPSGPSAPGPSASVGPVEAPVGPPATERVDPDLAADGGSGSWWPWALGAGVVVLLAAGGVVAVRRRRT
jgi:hypothetical protein